LSLAIAGAEVGAETVAGAVSVCCGFPASQLPCTRRHPARITTVEQHPQNHGINTAAVAARLSSTKAFRWYHIHPVEYATARHPIKSHSKIRLGLSRRDGPLHKIVAEAIATAIATGAANWYINVRPGGMVT
jgi:hypothetical protein